MTFTMETSFVVASLGLDLDLVTGSSGCRPFDVRPFTPHLAVWLSRVLAVCQRVTQIV